MEQIGLKGIAVSKPSRFSQESKREKLGLRLWDVSGRFLKLEAYSMKG
jgi:hypothetical protein